MGSPISDFTFATDSLIVRNYPYPPASVYPSKTLPVINVLEVGISCAPPEIRLKDGEVIFVSATKKDELAQWCTTNRIPMVRRIDVWGLLLEPFLDTTFSDEFQERTIKTLEECKIDRPEIEQVRARVSKAMMSYNFDSGLWDWVHLGLTDVLDALQGKLASSRHRLPPDEYARFYWYAMSLASKGTFIGNDSSELRPPPGSRGSPGTNSPNGE